MGMKYLDAKGQQCPMPIINLSKMMKAGASIGDVIKMEATDDACKSDVEAWCEKTGNRLLSWQHENAVHTMLIEKSS
jgi:tRNA 2-thiouridine synthesizing protein A